MGNIGKNESKINNMNGVNAVRASMNAIEIKENEENISKDAFELTQTQAKEETKKASNKHVVTYIGSSEFVDSNGHKWYKNTEQTYTDEEYNKRTDLHFMVDYGEMKHTVVTI